MDKILYYFIKHHYDLFDIKILKQMGKFYNLSISNRNALKYDLTQAFKKPKDVAIYTILKIEDFYRQLARSNKESSFLESIQRYYSCFNKSLYQMEG